MWLHYCIFACIWPFSDLDLSPLDLKFSEMLSTAPISVAQNLYLYFKIEWWLQNCVFVRWWPSLLTLKFSEMLNTVPAKSFSIGKSCHLVHWMELGLQNWILSHTWSCGDLDLWSLDLKFKKMFNAAPINLFPWIKVAVCWVEFWPQNWFFNHIWSCGDLYLWPSNFKKNLALSQ